MSRREFVFLSLALGLLAVPPCRAQSGDPDKLIRRTVVPSATDSRINTFTGGEYLHEVFYNPSAKDQGLLLVFLPGTGGTGANARNLCQLAANEGYHVLLLMYPDDVSMSAFHARTDRDAFRKARESVISGKAPYVRLNIGVPNSIENRLHALLAYADDRFPQENWGQFFLEKQGGPVDYSKLMLAGQSQGGGHAALMAYEHEVARVLMFGSPKDFNVHFNEPAKWYSSPSATPIDRFFSFVHSMDEGHGCTYPQQLQNYRAMTLMPKYAVVNVDNATAPYQHSHLLTSKRPEPSPHTSVIGDRAFTNVWQYMLEEPLRPDQGRATGEKSP